MSYNTLLMWFSHVNFQLNKELQILIFHYQLTYIDEIKENTWFTFGWAVRSNLSCLVKEHLIHNIFPNSLNTFTNVTINSIHTIVFLVFIDTSHHTNYH
jgi:ABC-type iron transport system FetAB permease component